MSPNELHSFIISATGPVLDVREPVEYTEEHIYGTELIPLGSLSAQTTAKFAKDQPLALFCRSGKRGSQALEKLRELGFSNLRNLEGGILAWKAAGLPTEQGKKGFPLMQQVQITIGLGVLAGVVLSKLLHPNWIYLSAFFGAGLIFAGTTGWCGLALLLAKMPWNKVKKSC
jgi:rhodanese-related sulfurtransferase